MISDRAKISGTLRSLEDGLSEEFEKDVRIALEELKEVRKISYNLDWKVYFPVLRNTDKEAEHVERVAKKLLGEEFVGVGCMPVKASEDFAFYTRIKPGAFFFLGSAKNELDDIMLHDCHFDFNDNLIPVAAQFWISLVNDRFLDAKL